MSPRGRRRGRRRGGKKGKSTKDQPRDQKPQGTKSKRRRRRRRRRKPKFTYQSFLDSAKMKKPEMLPPDELSAEAIISELKEEHGTPSTPQEFRLMLKVKEPTKKTSGGGEGRSSERRKSRDGREAPDDAPSPDADGSEGEEPGDDDSD